MKERKKDTLYHRHNEAADKVSEITRTMRPHVHNTSMDIASKHMVTLLAEPMDYVVHAVWGVKENGQLDEIQKLIHKKSEAVISQVYELLGMSDMSASQIFAICSLIRELIISKIAHSVEMVKGIMNRPKDSCVQDGESILSSMEMIGNA